MGLISRVSSRTYRPKDTKSILSYTTNMPPVDQKMAAELSIQSSRNVEQLKDECSRLASNNDKLVNVIAQNNASKQTIIDLQHRLEYAKKAPGDNLVDFTAVNENLDASLKEAKIKQAKEEATKADKVEENKALHKKKEELKHQQKRLEEELKNL